MPAWQNRQPRVQPRKISTFRRSCTTSTSGTSCFFGYGHSREVGDGALVDDGRDVGVAGRDRTHDRAVVLDVVERRDVDAGDRREVAQHGLAAPRAAALPRADDLDDLGDDLFAVADHERVDVLGERLGVVRAVAAGDDDRVRGRPVLVADGHAREVDQVQEVRVDELGREVEGEDVELGRGAVRVDAEQRHPGRAHRRLHVGPRRVGALGHRVFALVDELVEDLQPLVGEPDLVGIGIDQEKGRPAAPMAGRQVARLRPHLHTDVASGLLNPGQQRFYPRPQV